MYGFCSDFLKYTQKLMWAPNRYSNTEEKFIIGIYETQDQ